jgi:YD repeat-containing protein
MHYQIPTPYVAARHVPEDAAGVSPARPGARIVTFIYGRRFHKCRGLNGNLLSDGSNTYSYDHANRLIGASNAQSSANFAYNGLGDRLQQTLSGVTTQYTLDINNSLSQVLSDGANRYLYGMGRIAQQTPGGWQYFLPDALGSARQLSDAAGAVALAQSFDPYGNLLASQCSAAFGFDP